MSLVARIIIATIRLWQKTLSPDQGRFRFLYSSSIFSLSVGVKPGCRSYPSCSEYAIKAFKKHSPGRALTLSVKRIFYCHPLNNKRS